MSIYKKHINSENKGFEITTAIVIDSYFLDTNSISYLENNYKLLDTIVWTQGMATSDFGDACNLRAKLCSIQ